MLVNAVAVMEKTVLHVKKCVINGYGVEIIVALHRVIQENAVHVLFQ